MELNLNVLGKQQVASTTETKKMKMSQHAQSMVFQMFTKNVYSNPIGTVVREITSNCFDSHVEAGVQNTPVLIKKTYDTQTDTNYISFIDYGVGMSPDRVENIYSVYFESSKRQTNNEIGGFGIGGKTPLAYKRYTGEGDGEYDNSFFVITNYNGIKYYYTVFEGQESPEYSLFHSEKTDERNGTEIRIPVLSKDIDKFELELVRQLYYFEGIIFEGFSERVKNDYQIIRGKNFLYRGNDITNAMHVCLGKVYYPIDFNVLGLYNYDYQIPIAIDIPIGAVGVTVSRESLDYSEQTVNYLKKRIKDVIEELTGMLEKQYDNVHTLEEYFQLNDNFGFLSLGNDKSLNLKGFIKKSEIDLSKFKYSMFKTPSSSILFELFFNVKRYGKKEGVRYYRDNLPRFQRDYNGIIKADNIYYSKANEFKIKRIKQSYLKNEHGRYYLIFKNDLVTQWANVCDIFNIHFDSKDDFIKSDTYKHLQQMQEEYYNIVLENARCYEEVEVPEDFKTNYGKPKLTGDILKSTIPVRYGWGKDRIKIKELVDFNGKIFYGTPDEDIEAQNCRNVFSILFNGDHLADDYRFYSNGFGKKKGVMIITLAKNNQKYMKYCKNAYPISQFYYKIVQRKEDEIIQTINNDDLHDKYREIDSIYKSDLFKNLSSKWEGKIEKVNNFINSLKSRHGELRYRKTWLDKYIDFNNVQQTYEEKVVRKHIDDLMKLQMKNRDVLDLIDIPYFPDKIDNNKKELLIKILKKVMSF